MTVEGSWQWGVMKRRTAAEDNARRGDTPVPDSQDINLKSRACYKQSTVLLSSDKAVTNWPNIGCLFTQRGAPDPRESRKGMPNYLE